MIEYGLLVALIAIVVLAGAFSFGNAIHSWYTDMFDALTSR